MLAALGRSTRARELLVAAGADLAGTTRTGCTLLHYAACCTPSQQALLLTGIVPLDGNARSSVGSASTAKFEQGQLVCYSDTLIQELESQGNTPVLGRGVIGVVTTFDSSDNTVRVRNMATRNESSWHVASKLRPATPQEVLEVSRPKEAGGDWRCVGGHKLSAKPSSEVGHHFCDVCNTETSADNIADFLNCKDCKFDLCVECRKPVSGRRQQWNV